MATPRAPQADGLAPSRTNEGLFRCACGAIVAKGTQGEPVSCVLGLPHQCENTDFSGLAARWLEAQLKHEPQDAEINLQRERGQKQV